MAITDHTLFPPEYEDLLKKKLLNTRPGMIVPISRGADMAMMSPRDYEPQYDPYDRIDRSSYDGYGGRPGHPLDIIKACMTRKDFESMRPDNQELLEREAEGMYHRGYPMREAVDRMRHFIARSRESEELIKQREKAERQAMRNMATAGPPPPRSSQSATEYMIMKEEAVKHSIDPKHEKIAVDRIPIKKIYKEPAKELTIYEQLQTGVDEWLDGVLPQPA